MKSRDHIHIAFRGELGFSLVELMVAIFLTLILALAASQSYLLNKRTFRATQEVSKVQQNLRFASHYINKELRQAGNLGCFQSIKSHLDVGLSSPMAEANLIPLYDLSKPVNVWQYQPAEDVFDLGAAGAYSTPSDSAAAWVDLAGRVRPHVLAGKVMVGSDILLITKISEPLDMQLSDNNSPVISSLAMREGTTHSIVDGQLVLVGDCDASELFVHAESGESSLGYTVSSDFVPHNRLFTKWRRSWQGSHELRVLESTLYYIGLGASGLPALYKLDVGLGVGGDAVHEEVVDGIEVLKILLGVDGDGDRRIDQYQTVNALADSDEILGVQIGLLSVSDVVGSDEALLQKDYEVLPGFMVTSPEVWDGGPDKRLRYVSSNAVHIKNAGLARATELTYK